MLLSYFELHHHANQCLSPSSRLQIFKYCFREIERKDEELGYYKKMSNEQYTKEMGKLDDRDKEIAKLQYTVRLAHYHYQCMIFYV